MNTNTLKEFIKFAELQMPACFFFIRDEMVNAMLKKHDVVNSEVMERQHRDPLSNQFVLFRQYLIKFVSVAEEYTHIHKEPK